MIYEVDLGDHTEMWSYKAIEAFYRNNVDKGEYPTYDIWLDDMTKHDLIREVA